MKHLIVFLIILFSIGITFSQTRLITGTVSDGSGSPIPSANILEKGTKNGTITDIDGKYSLSVSKDAVLVFSYVGFSSKEIPISNRSIVNVTLVEGKMLEDIVFIGSRGQKRTLTETSVPVDIIDFENIPTQNGKVEINQLLQYAAPSFNATKQSGADGSEHIDPATLRGLGPDQTLVLINGKRRHQSSLINLIGTRGRGNTGTDLNAIPKSAIKRIEILRDGASAQYGSDAIAGVINIVLKDNSDGLTGYLSYGAYNTKARGDFPENTPNTSGFRLDTKRDGNQIGKDKALDGGSIKSGINYGLPIGKKGGFANTSLEYLSKNKTLRPGFDFRKGYGEAAIDGFSIFENLLIPVSKNAEFYAFGGRNYRETDAFAFTRPAKNDERSVEIIYPKGFTPRITSNIVDLSITSGIRTKTKDDWNIDLSNTYGKNYFHYFIKGTLNASLEENSPTEFDAGGHQLSQNTVNFDISKYFKEVLGGLNLAFGTEYRTENFIVFAGEEGSYSLYDTIGRVITDTMKQVVPTIEVINDKGKLDTIPRPGGSQGFPGYGLSNEVDVNRSSLSLYVDSELDITKSLLVSAAARFEKYSDFGSTINGKLSSRLKLTDNINLRGSLSTGFRAPSLAQVYYSLQFTDISGEDLFETIISQNNSPVTRSFGIGPLREEKALNVSFGAAASFGGFSASIDFYHINVNDRIVLTGLFGKDKKEDKFRFFTNGVDTETNGLDIVASWRKKWNNSSLNIGFIGNINNLIIKRVKNGSLPEKNFFSIREQYFLLASAPDNKFSLNIGYKINRFDLGLSLTRFSKVELYDSQIIEDYDDKLLDSALDLYNAKIITDVAFGFKLNDKIKFTIGSNNIFNRYPDQQDNNTDGGGYWDAVQMGTSGAYYYGKVDFNF